MPGESTSILTTSPLPDSLPGKNEVAPSVTVIGGSFASTFRTSSTSVEWMPYFTVTWGADPSVSPARPSSAMSSSGIAFAIWTTRAACSAGRLTCVEENLCSSRSAFGGDRSTTGGTTGATAGGVACGATTGTGGAGAVGVAVSGSRATMPKGGTVTGGVAVLRADGIAPAPAATTPTSAPAAPASTIRLGRS